MKRDMDLVRTILIVMSENEEGPNIKWEEKIPGHTNEQILHHAHLMGQGGLVMATDVTSMGDRLPMALPMSITWAGQDFLDAIRDPGLWDKAKSTVLKPAGGVAFTVLLEWAKSEGMRRLGLA